MNGSTRTLLDTNSIIEWAAEGKDWARLASQLLKEEPIAGWIQVAEATRWLAAWGLDERVWGPMMQPWLRVEPLVHADFVEGGHLAAEMQHQGRRRSH